MESFASEFKKVEQLQYVALKMRVKDESTVKQFHSLGQHTRPAPNRQ